MPVAVRGSYAMVGTLHGSLKEIGRTHQSGRQTLGKGTTSRTLVGTRPPRMRLIVLPHFGYATLVPAARQDGLPRLSHSVPADVKTSPPAPTASKARQRILDAAYELFSQHGIRGVGIDSIIERSGV